MGLFGAMTASVSGLASQGQAISVISDNLANTNTVGYKSSRSLFSQLVTTAGSGVAYNAGGVNTATQRAQGVQGSLSTTSSNTDLAITGNGYFRVSDSRVATSSTSYYYTRAGAFSEDKEGYLADPNGYFLQGWRTDSDGNISNLQDLVNIELQSVGVSAQATNTVTVGANLNSSTAPLSALYDTTGSLSASLDNVLGSTNAGIFLTDVRVYDAQGTARDITIAYSKRAANVWDYQVYTDGSNIQGGTAGTKTRIGSGELRFNSNGTLKYATNTSMTANWSDGVTASDLTFKLGDYSGGKIVTGNANLAYTDDVLDIGIENESMASDTYTLKFTSATAVDLVDSGGNTVATGTIPATATNREIVLQNDSNNVKVRLTLSENFTNPTAGFPDTSRTFTVGAVAAYDTGRANDGVVQYSSSSNNIFNNQNGFGSGLLSSIQIGGDGYVSGTFTNGETKKLYKVALAVFQNQGGLEPISGSLLRTTDASGSPLIKEPGVGGTGRLVSGALEGSTTDIASEFSTMIVTQRAFQANSTVIQTVDQMLNSLLQIR